MSPLVELSFSFLFFSLGTARGLHRRARSLLSAAEGRGQQFEGQRPVRGPAMRRMVWWASSVVGPKQLGLQAVSGLAGASDDESDSFPGRGLPVAAAAWLVGGADKMGGCTTRGKTGFESRW
jgi:hypothetical protein